MFDLCSMLLWIKRVTCMVPEKWLRAFWYEAALLWHINCSEWVVLGQNMNYSISYFSHCAKCCPPHFAAQQKWTFKNRTAKEDDENRGVDTSRMQPIFSFFQKEKKIEKKTVMQPGLSTCNHLFHVTLDHSVKHVLFFRSSSPIAGRPATVNSG